MRFILSAAKIRFLFDGLLSGGLLSGGLMSGGLMSGRLMSGGLMSGRLMSGGLMSGGLMSGGPNVSYHSQLHRFSSQTILTRLTPSCSSETRRP